MGECPKTLGWSRLVKPSANRRFQCTGNFDFQFSIPAFAKYEPKKVVLRKDDFVKSHNSATGLMEFTRCSQIGRSRRGLWKKHQINHGVLIWGISLLNIAHILLHFNWDDNTLIYIVCICTYWKFIYLYIEPGNFLNGHGRRGSLQEENSVCYVIGLEVGSPQCGDPDSRITLSRDLVQWTVMLLQDWL